MAKSLKLDTPTAREKLKPRPGNEPYWLRLDSGRYLGFRAGADTWIARFYVGGKEKYRYKPLDAGDDEKLAYAVAKELAEKWFATLRSTGSADALPSRYTMDLCITEYVDDRRVHKDDAAAHAADVMLKRDVLEKFKGREVATLTTAEFKKWLHGFIPRGADQDDKRAARETANRKWSQFRAALALAFRDGKVADDKPWRRIKPFEDVGRNREFYPTAEQVSALIEHCDAAFSPLAKACVLTGFRLQALTGATVADFDEKDGTLNIRADKGHERIATLSSAAVELFKEQAKDKTPAAYLFTRADGREWRKSEHFRPFNAARDKTIADRDVPKEAKPPREFILYSLRHYFISRALLAGVNVNALAKNVGTSTKMIEKHYGKFIKSDVRAMLDRVALPKIR